MAKSCAPCGSKMAGRKTALTPGRRKQWRVFFDGGATRDYYEESDADQAVAKHGGRKQKLSS